MKRTISILICTLILMTAMTFVAAANDLTNTYVYEADGVEYTVNFEDSTVSIEKQEIIAQRLIGLNDSNVQTYGLGCTLFGHDYAYTTASVITHKVRTYSPRCKKEMYDVTYCEDCDYTEQTLTSTSYISCCPAD